MNTNHAPRCRTKRNTFRFAICLTLAIAVRQTAALADNATTQSSPPTVVYLKIAKTNPPVMTLFAREIWRQAFLIAARDGLGMQTRDDSLREWRGKPPAELTVSPLIGMTPAQPDDFSFQIQGPGKTPVVMWHRTSEPWYKDYPSFIALAEQESREELVQAMRAQGWTGAANHVKADGPAADDAEVNLAELQELTQFVAVRQAHALIRTDGESPQRLGVLVRGYANLGQLTRYHWSIEQKAFIARSLLYAQRMVVNDPRSAYGLWHRAYALAMAGLQGPALDDLKAAAALEPSARPPDWVALLEPFCKYQSGQLTNIAVANPAQAPLALFMAFVTVEQSGSQAATMNLAQAAFQANPNCLRIVEAMCDNTGPGMLNSLIDVGPDLFSKSLGEHLGLMPGLPLQVDTLMNSLRRSGGNPAGREIVCNALLKNGAPEQDKGEPSWAALGSLIQETTFAQLERHADLIANKWGVDASDYVKEIQPLIAQHPFKHVVDAYGFEHGNATEMNAVLQDLSWDRITLAVLPFYYLQTRAQSGGTDTAARVWEWISTDSDQASWDLEGRLRLILKADPTLDGLRDQLKRVSPQSPYIPSIDVFNHWETGEKEAIDWTTEHGDYPTVALALGRKYAELKDWNGAEKYLRKYVTVSPDFVGYQALAGLFHDQQKDDQWLATLQEFLKQPNEYGLEHAQVQTEIARYFMARGQYKEALPYADAAGDTASGWGLICAANAHTGIGDFEKAEALLVDEMNHYSDSPYIWYAWCVKTGKGDRAGATTALKNFLDGRGEGSAKDMLQYATMSIIEGNDANALAMFQRRMSADAGARSGLHIAVLADRMKQHADRDVILRRVMAMDKTPLIEFAIELQKTFAKGPDAIPDSQAIESILGKSSPEEANEICYFTGQYLAQHGHIEESHGYLKRCLSNYEAENVEFVLAIDSLRKQGVDVPLPPFATTEPAKAK
ncbi:MAG: hypothetical protein M3O30_04925 [Planctomycetota bacterium]|nr:hypothetical protein [Planctomycetota bacterium]